MINKKTAMAFIRSLVDMRKAATDNQALAAPAIYPTWKEGIEYASNDRLLYNGVLYRVLLDHISQASWTPEEAPSLFAKILIPNEETIFAWEQPNSTNAYKKEDKVTHKDKIWVSIIDNNVWEPGVYGWEEEKDSE